MDVHERHEGQLTILQPQMQRMDASNASMLKNKLIDLLSRNRDKIALDMSQVDFMDSTGLAALLSARKSLGKQGNLVLFSLSDNVRKLFTITRLDQGVFPLFSSEQKAVQALLEFSEANG